MTVAKATGGGAFLIEDASPGDVFTPEDFSEEQRQIARAASEFAENSILPRAREMEAKNLGVTRQLLREAGELGFLAVDSPEEYGGSNLDRVTSAIIADRIAVYASFSVSFSAHCGIGTLPLVWYGAAEQKRRYLPKLSSGEWVAAYALSEASSGSDAMNIRTQARLSADGAHYILNGEKMWTSNAGMADLFTVFAKIDGEKFSAFLIEAGTAGLSVGGEEHKMGIRGSSTCPLSLSDCMVPAENLLGEAGKGHHIAFNILNVGRYKLGAAAVGGARFSLRQGIRYANERMAFGKPIASFGLIQQKIAESAALVFAGEALVYRVVGAIDAALSALEPDAAQSGRAIEEYAVECSIVKVWCSEMLERVVDHVLQIHGGYGYTEEFPAERGYRDARINRIFEGTNEINRLIVTGWTMKRAREGRLPLLPAIQSVMDAVFAGPPRQEQALAPERTLLAAAKKLCLFSAGVAAQRYAAELTNQQEVMGAMADVVIEILAMESAVLRAEKMAYAAEGAGRAESAVRLARYYAARSFRIVRDAAEAILAACSEGDDLRTQMAIFRRLSKHEPMDTVSLGRQIAGEMSQAGRYTQ